MSLVTWKIGKSECVPHLRVGPHETAEILKMAWNGKKERPEVALKLASREQVLDVLAHWAAHGCSLKQSLARKHVPPEAFWERVQRKEPEVEALWQALKGQWAFVAMDDVYDQATALAAAGNVGALSIRAKQAGTMAKAMDQNTWSDRVQIESKQLVIISNLFDNDPAVLTDDRRGFMSPQQAREAGLITAERAAELVEAREVQELDLIGLGTVDCGAVAQTEAEKKAEAEFAEPDWEPIFRAQGGRPIIRPRSE